MHFSVCSSSSTHSAGSDFSILCRVRTPRPHVTLHSLQSDQGDSMHGMVSADTQRRGPGVSSTNDRTDQSVGMAPVFLTRFRHEATHGTPASCTSPPRPPQSCTRSRQQGASSPCARVASSPGRRWRCRGPTRPTLSPRSCWPLDVRQRESH